MCEPATLGMMAASAALSAGGNMISQNEAQNNANAVAGARNSVLAASLARQKKFGEEARGLFDTRMADYADGAQPTALGAAQDARTVDVTKPMSTPVADVAVSRSAPGVVRSTIAKSMLDAFNGATERAKATAKLGGYGDTWFNNKVGVADTGRRIGTINNFSGNEAALLPADQEFASIQAQKQPSIWGPLLQSGGNFLAMGAGRGFNPFGSAPGVAPSLYPTTSAAAVKF